MTTISWSPRRGQACIPFPFQQFGFHEDFLLIFSKLEQDSTHLRGRFFVLAYRQGSSNKFTESVIITILG